MRIRVYILCPALLMLWSVTTFAQGSIEVKEKQVFAIGESVVFTSSVLKEERKLNIYLPSSYQRDSLKRYPVIYLLDGSADEDFIHISGLVQFGSFSWISMIPETIVVGIANVDRTRDFTYPTRNAKDKKAFPTAGGSEKFMAFIAEEVQPFIDRTYRTNSVKTLIGQSLGGLLATEILFKKPTLFAHFIIVSPSLWWDDESLLKDIPLAYSLPKTIYIGVGKEGPVMERVARALFEKLRLVKKDDNKLYFTYFEALSHGDALHLAVYDSFEKIFRK
ncbi:MAG: alpha/beta hydrolase-fold protein [Bacteroidota bacterium]